MVDSNDDSAVLAKNPSNLVRWPESSVIFAKQTDWLGGFAWSTTRNAYQEAGSTCSLLDRCQGQVLLLKFDWNSNLSWIRVGFNSWNRCWRRIQMPNAEVCSKRNQQSFVLLSGFGQHCKWHSTGNALCNFDDFQFDNPITGHCCQLWRNWIIAEWNDFISGVGPKWILVGYKFINCDSKSILDKRSLCGARECPSRKRWKSQDDKPQENSAAKIEEKANNESKWKQMEKKRNF